MCIKGRKNNSSQKKKERRKIERITLVKVVLMFVWVSDKYNTWNSILNQIEVDWKKILFPKEIDLNWLKVISN